MNCMVFYTTPSVSHHGVLLSGIGFRNKLIQLDFPEKAGQNASKFILRVAVQSDNTSRMAFVTLEGTIGHL